MLENSSKKSAFRRHAFWVTTLLIVGGLTAGWWLWEYHFKQPHRLNYILMNISGEPRKVLSGETVQLHPDDSIQMITIDTTIPLNMGVRLVATGIDINALRYEPIPLRKLLPQQDPFERYTFVIEVKHNNQVIGDITWIVQPFVKDWLEKANRIIDDEKRLTLLERGVKRLPGEKRLQKRLLEEYKAQEKWRKAAGLLMDMAEKDATYETLSQLLGIYRKIQNTDGIIAVLTQLLKLNPEDMQAREGLADALAEEGKWRQAIDEYQAILAQTQNHDRLYLYKRLGYLYTQSGEFKPAIEAYLHAAKLDQKDANIHYNLSYLYEKIGDKEKADFYLNNAITLKSDDIEGRLDLAERLVKKGRYPSAKRHLSAVLKRQPDSVKALVLMARVLENQEDKSALKKVYRKLLSVSEDNDTLIYNLAALEYETGNLSAARKYALEYLKLHPDDATAHDILFDIYQQQNKLEKAYEQAVALVALRPEDLGPYAFIYDYLTKKGHHEQMIPILKKGLETNPEAIALKKYLFKAYLAAEKTDGAMVQAESLLEARSPDILSLMHTLFAYLHQRSDYPRIITIMNRAVKGYPSTPFYRECLILAYLKTNQENRAITEMEALLNLRPKDVKRHLQLARLKEKNNDLKGALSAYKQVLELVPDHPEASEAYLRLRLEGVKQEK